MTSSPLSGEPLALPTEVVHYVKCLNEPIEKYTPYFDALFIKRRKHTSFFRDLKSFRCQEHVIALLTTPSDTPDLDIKALYRQCSKLFLASRFAHPWCRTTPGATKDAWFKAEWGNIKKQSEANRKEEERLHRLLVPIWCGFRVRMMPSDEQLESFVEGQRKVKGRRLAGPMGTESLTDSDAQGESHGADSEPAADVCIDINAVGKTPRQTMDEIPTSPHFNAEAFVSEEDDRIYDKNTSADSGGASTAAKMFIGVAATTFLAQNPRARKYLWKKLQKQGK